MGKGINTGHDQEPGDGRLEIIIAQEQKSAQASHLSSLHRQKRKESEERASRAT